MPSYDSAMTTNKTIIWVDSETGGLYPEQHDVTQIAAILDVDGVAVAEINLLMRPDPKRVSKGALDVQKKTMEQVLAHPLSQREGYESFLATLREWTKGGKASFGGQNVPFDAGFLKKLFADNGTVSLSEFFDGTTVDTKHVAEGLRARGGLNVRNVKLGTICDALGVKLGDGAHDALNDIRATREAFVRMMQTKTPSTAT